MEIVLVASLVALAYTYFGYPLLIWCSRAYFRDGESRSVPAPGRGDHRRFQ